MKEGELIWWLKIALPYSLYLIPIIIVFGLMGRWNDILFIMFGWGLISIIGWVVSIYGHHVFELIDWYHEWSDKLIDDSRKG